MSNRVGEQVSFEAHDLVLLVIHRDHLSGTRTGERKTELSKQKKQNQLLWKWHPLKDVADAELRTVDTATELMFISKLPQTICG